MTWPLGPVCSPCYYKHRKSPAPCAECCAVRILVGRTAAGNGLCATCCDHEDAAARCRLCTAPADLRPDGLCPHCSLTDQLRHLLADDAGTVPAHLHPLVSILTDAANPYPVLDWVRRSPSAHLLAQLVRQPGSLTHEALDALPQNAPTSYIRGLLVTAGILVKRDENLARLERWVKHTLANLPSHHANIIRPFAQWHTVRDARRRSARGRYTVSAGKGDANNIRCAQQFLAWLDTHGLQLSTLKQPDLDLWTATHPSKASTIVSFIRWAQARRLVTGLDIHYPPSQYPATFQPEDAHHEQLRRCLTDTTLPLDVRITGALIRLYALPLSRIVELTADRYSRDSEATYLTINRHPVILPPTLGRLIEEQIDHLSGTSAHRRQIADELSYLLPGQSPGCPRNPLGLADTLRRHDLPARAARNTAMIEAIADIPPIVMADLFGIQPHTANRWAQLVSESWSHYLAAP
ncbi:hypothetical protein AB4039_25330 [Streptomyces sp. M-16]|uniref:hypothetical protein n=1 Tax=Streptomyces sp. M-16 TaxID=3233040 RepID=UPI003F99B1F1